MLLTYSLKYWTADCNLLNNLLYRQTYLYAFRMLTDILIYILTDNTLTISLKDRLTNTFTHTYGHTHSEVTWLPCSLTHSHTYFLKHWHRVRLWLWWLTWLTHITTKCSANLLLIDTLASSLTDILTDSLTHKLYAHWHRVRLWLTWLTHWRHTCSLTYEMHTRWHRVWDTWLDWHTYLLAHLIETSHLLSYLTNMYLIKCLARIHSDLHTCWHTDWLTRLTQWLAYWLTCSLTYSHQHTDNHTYLTFILTDLLAYYFNAYTLLLTL